MDPDATWYGGKRGPGDVVLDGSQLPRKGAQPPSFSGQTAGWMKTPFGTEVDLGPGHILLDGVPALRERGTAPPPLFGPSIVATHGRPSQLLLSSCFCFNDYVF